MNRLPLVLLLAAFAACRKPAPATPAAPTAAALGAELATFPQLLLPLTPASAESMLTAIKRDGLEKVTESSFTQSYIHGKATANGRTISTFVAYSTPWLALKGAPLQQMSPLQFMNAFAKDAETDVAVLITPKGNIVFARGQLLDIIGAVRAAGNPVEYLPFALVRGSGKP